MIITDVDQLRLPCSDVSSLEEAQEIIRALQDELKASSLRGQPGIGLAAPQIGIQKNVAIVRLPDLQGRNYSLNLINPKLHSGRLGAHFDQEGCLSFPNQRERVYRYQEICVDNHLDSKMIESLVLMGLPAVVAQHEYDHLIGKLLIDHVDGKKK